jgi:hypothetical protein
VDYYSRQRGIEDSSDDDGEDDESDYETDYEPEGRAEAVKEEVKPVPELGDAGPVSLLWHLREERAEC